MVYKKQKTNKENKCVYVCTPRLTLLRDRYSNLTVPRTNNRGGIWSFVLRLVNKACRAVLIYLTDETQKLDFTDDVIAKSLHLCMAEALAGVINSLRSFLPRI